MDNHTEFATHPYRRLLPVRHLQRRHHGTQEIAFSAVRERQLESVTDFLSRTPSCIKYGDMHKGLEDSMLLPTECQRPIPDNIRNKIHGVSPESLVARRLSHPEEFSIRSPGVRH